MRCSHYGLRLGLFFLGVTLSAVAAAVVHGEQPGAAQPPYARLALIPPSPMSEQITLDIRGAVYNTTAAAETVEVAFYLDDEKPEQCLHRQKVEVAGNSAGGATFRWPAKGHAGEHRILMTATTGAETLRAAEPIRIVACDQRSLARLGGAWVDIYHHGEDEARPFNAELGKMTDSDWRSLVQAMHESDQDIMVITMMFQNFTHYGRHKMETEGYHGKAYYPSKLYPGRMPIASQDPLEAILSEADRLGMHVMPGVGCYAFFDYTPASLRWHKEVARELWERYGRHPSFYGWYISGEKDGGLGSAQERKEIVEFFKELTPYLHQMAPEKPVMLAPNCYHLRGAEDTYRQLLPNLDIICPFAFHRMPAGDLTGEESATLMQSLCDRAGTHLWMDLETFVFRNGSELHPRPIDGLLSDLSRFPNFEKTLHYQFPGLMSSPAMPRKPGGPASVKLYEDYRAYLEGRIQLRTKISHEAVGRPVKLAAPYSPMYPAAGAAALTDGKRAFPEYRDPRWQGFHGEDLDATIDLGKATEVRTVTAGFLRYVIAGIYLRAEVEVAVSDDGQEFRLVGTVKPESPPAQDDPTVRDVSIELKQVTARYVRVRARSLRTIPAGQPGAGEKAWLFVDEIAVNPALPK